MINQNEEKEFIISNMSWPFDETRNAFFMPSFKNLSNEIILHIFRYLSVNDLCNVSLVCRSFKMLADHDDI